MRKILYIFGLALLLISCSKDDDFLSSSQRDMIGQGVNFSASIADPFSTRTTYRHDGSFNEGDIMTIYRQYSEDGGISFDATTEAYRVYELTNKKATGTEFVLETDWLPKAGELGSNAPSSTFTQTDADSLTWENGKTVRFRGWSRSNLASAISNSSQRSSYFPYPPYRYYPDYCISEWVTVSGPTMDVPMSLKHQGCRIGIIAKAGNELQRAEICTDWEDYMRPDNNTTYDNDESTTEHGKTEEQAKAEAKAVQDVYNRMCMPAGVDIVNSLLNTLTQDKYNDTETNFRYIHAETDGIVKFNTLSAEDIKNSVQRPVFCSNDGRLYMITIPYDMSTASTRGETMILPACTRFKIWLYDVNDGDKTQTDHDESNYHILTLGDLKDRTGTTQMFPNGLELIPGRSYMFSVGYHYDSFTVTPVDDFSWDDTTTPEEGPGVDDRQAETAPNTYTWWKTAIENAIPTSIQQSYRPEFHIKTVGDFLEFIKLVNGTAATKTSGITSVVVEEDDTTTSDPDDKKEVTYWYRDEAFETDGSLKEGAVAVDKATLEAEGYIFYQHYHPANADQPAYTVEDYLKGPYSFYDEDLSRHFTVYLDNDLDFQDVKIEASVGNTSATPFRGVFDGFDRVNDKIYSLKNIYMQDGYLFKYCQNTAIRNLNIETVHDFMLMKEASVIDQDGYGAYIVGITIKAPCIDNPFAHSLTGSSYVVGCYYEGTYHGSYANGAMVGTADDLYMYGNMMVASGLPSGTGALLGAYANSSNKFFAPQTSKKVEWSRFMVNYYDKELSPGTNAVGNIADDYKPQEYIRGAHSYILKAKNDNLLSDEVDYDEKIKPYPRMVEGYYGLAPWKAMNYAIWRYNEVGKIVSEPHNCKSHFVNDNVGYAHVYPRRVVGEPNSDGQPDVSKGYYPGPADDTGYQGRYDELNVMEQNN